MEKGQKQQNDIRCGHCNRKLGEGIYQVLAIKCPRCGTLNHLRASTHPPRASERPITEDTNGDFKNQAIR